MLTHSGWIFSSCPGYLALVLEVVDHAPTVTILSPEPGTTFVEGEVARFTGRVRDQESECEEVICVWSSDRDGVLHVQTTCDRPYLAVLEISSLQVGEHVIWLTATDAAGQEGRASVYVTVVP